MVSKAIIELEQSSMNHLVWVVGFIVCRITQSYFSRLGFLKAEVWYLLFENGSSSGSGDESHKFISPLRRKAGEVLFARGEGGNGQTNTPPSLFLP